MIKKQSHLLCSTMEQKSMTLILLALTFLRRKIWDEAYLLHTFPPESEEKSSWTFFSTIWSP